MASLYIKDSETAALADEIARALGETKTDVVRNLLRQKKAELDKVEAKPDFLEWMKQHRRDNPLPPPTGRKADKAFFDRMWGEED